MDWLLQQPMLREQWLRENDPEENADVEHHMEVEGLTEDMIFEGSAEENRMWQCHERSQRLHAQTLCRYLSVGRNVQFYIRHAASKFL